MAAKHQTATKADLDQQEIVIKRDKGCTVFGED